MANVSHHVRHSFSTVCGIGKTLLRHIGDVVIFGASKSPVFFLELIWFLEFFFVPWTFLLSFLFYQSFIGVPIQKHSVIYIFVIKWYLSPLTFLLTFCCSLVYIKRTLEMWNPSDLDSMMSNFTSKYRTYAGNTCFWSRLLHASLGD